MSMRPWGSSSVALTVERSRFACRRSEEAVVVVSCATWAKRLVFRPAWASSWLGPRSIEHAAAAGLRLGRAAVASPLEAAWGGASLSLSA